MKLAFNFLAHVIAFIGPAWLAFYSDLTWVKVVLGASSILGVINFWQWLRMIADEDRLTEIATS